ncbi:MAG: zinc-ribbon domain-containing protein [Deltaproteobacteria bacterium]|nr:zinc-ribbon domain-containing protein [Deltaproteobacteria bacterium]
MDISCNHCGTEYEFEDEDIPEEGIRVKCEVCQNIFVISKTPPGDAEKPESDEYTDDEEGALEEEEEEEEEKTFMIRNTEGEILRFRELDTLHDWIRDGTVGGDDEISSNGESWATLKDLPQLEEVFKSVKRRKTAESQAFRISSSGFSNTQDTDHHMGNVKLEDDEPDFGDISEQKTKENRQRPKFEETDNDESSSKLPWVIGILFLVSGVAFGGLFYLGVIPFPFSGTGNKSNSELKNLTTGDKTSEMENILLNSQKKFAGNSDSEIKSALNLLKGCKSDKCKEYSAFIHGIWAYYLNSDMAGLRNEKTQQISRIAGLKKIMKLHADKASEILSGRKISTPYGYSADILSRLVQGQNVDGSLKKAYSLFPSHPAIMLVDFLNKPNAESSDVFLNSFGVAVKNFSKKRPEDVTYLKYALALRYEALGKNDKAKALFLEICSQYPSHLRACNRGNAAVPDDTNVEQKNDSMTPPGMDPAVSSMNNKSSSPDDEKGDFDSFFMKAEQFYKVGNKKKARKYYLKASAADPTNADPLNGAGWCDMDTGNPAGAIGNFKKALALVPHYGRSRYGLAEALNQLGKKKEALAQYRVYLQKHSGSRFGARVKAQIAVLEKALDVNGNTEKVDDMKVEPDKKPMPDMKVEPDKKPESDMKVEPDKKVEPDMKPIIIIKTMSVDEKKPADKKPDVKVKPAMKVELMKEKPVSSDKKK